MDRDLEKLLQDKITEAATAYYTGHSMMTDSEFDQLLDEMIKINPHNPILRTPGWGYVPQGLSKVKHKYQTVGSLSKYRDLGSMIDSRSKGKVPIMSAKLDGCSCVAYYHDGFLEKAVTRGNGEEGLDITDKFIAITGVRKCEVYEHFTGGVRLEMVMKEESWVEFKERFPEYKNSRNAVAGLINSKFSTYEELQDKCQYISGVAYKITGTDPDHMEHTFREPRCGNSYTNVLSMLHHLGFVIVPWSFYENPEDERKFYEDCLQTYPCDGLVFNFGVNPEGEAIIYDDVAFKFEDEKVETRVNKVIWNQTRTGRFVPVAEIEPVELCGATISRVTCFNALYVKNNRIGPGAYVEIMRSGEVIPDIQRVTVESEPELPTVCPDCGEKLDWDGVDLECRNTKCKAAIFNRLYRWISYVAEVKGLAYSGICDFIDFFRLSNIEDIYDNYTETTMKMSIEVSDFGSATKDKYYKVIEKLFDEIDLRYILCGLNIDGIGWNTAETIAYSHLFDKINEISDDSLYDGLYSLSGIGYNTVQTIMNNLDLIKSIIERVKIKPIYETVNSEGTRKFCVTGSLEFGSRSEFCDYLKEKGWELVSVSDAEYLVTNDPDPSSSKGKKAKKLGIPIVTEKEFLEIVNK